MKLFWEAAATSTLGGGNMTEQHPSQDTSTFVIKHALVEFKQKYENGWTVAKRGLDAAPVVMRKYGIGAKDVMSFTNHEGRNQAFTAFHFHPDFPVSERRPYMGAHRDGYELVNELYGAREAERAADKKKWVSRFVNAGKTAALIGHTMILYLVTHHPDGR